MKRIFLLFTALFLIASLIILPKNANSAPDLFALHDLITTYTFGWWGGIYLAQINASSIQIQRFWIPEAIRQGVTIDVGWSQGASGTGTLIPSPSDTPFARGINDTLTVLDQYGMTAFFSVPLSSYGTASPWTKLVLEKYPDLKTYNSSGAAWNDQFVRPDSQNLTKQLLDDMLQLYASYSSHPSWVGFVNVGGYQSDHGAYDGIGGLGGYGYGNDTIINYANSQYCQDGTTTNSTCSYLITAITKNTTAELSLLLQTYHSAGNNPRNNWNYWLNLQFTQNLLSALKNFSQITNRTWLYSGEGRVYGIGAEYHTLPIDDLMQIGTGPPECPTNPGPYSQRKVQDYMSLVNEILKARNVQPLLYSTEPRLACSFSNEQLWNNFFYFPFYGARGQLLLDPSVLQDVYFADYQIFVKFGSMLNRMSNVGDFYGRNNPNSPKVLVLAGTGQPYNALQYLTPSLNLTLATQDSNLTRFGDLKQFDVVLMGPQGDYSFILTQDAVTRLHNFVTAGGGFVWAGGNVYPDSLDDIFGYSKSIGTFTKGTLQVTDENSPILKPYGQSILAGGFDFGGRGNTKFVVLAGASSTIIVNDTNLGPISWTNSYSAGRAVFLPYSSNWKLIGNPLSNPSPYVNSPRDSWMVLVTNALFYASKKESMIPTWWYSTYRSAAGSQLLPWSPHTFYSILGTPGEPVLVWFFTNSTTADNIEVHLNASYYGIDKNNWIAVNAIDWSIVNKGTTDDVKLNVTIPAHGWYPVYILNTSSLTYSNVKINSATTQGSIKKYTMKGADTFDSWLITKSDQRPNSVSLNTTGVITEYSSLSTLNQSKIGWRFEGVWNNYNEQGWYWDSANKLLYVHFRN